MILAQNLPRLLSGNNGWLLIGAILLFTSCDLFKKAQSNGKDKEDEEELEPIQGRRVYDPETGQWVVVREAPTEKLDTIVWKDISEEQYPPIITDTRLNEEGELIGVNEYGSEFLQSYDVALVLPFLGNRFDSDRPAITQGISKWALNFYGGVQMALNELEEEGVKLNVSVHDSQASEATTRNLLQNEEDIKNAHMIIGPYRRDNIRLLTDFAKRNDISFVSPYSGSSNLSDNNPNYIQVSPTLQTHCEAIIQNALAKFRPEQIVLVGLDRPEDRQALKFFQDEYFRQEGSRDVLPLKEYIVVEQTAGFDSLDVVPFIELQDTTAFIVSVWSQKAEAFAFSFLRKVDLARQDYNYVSVYGLPPWLGFDYVDYDYYENLNVHISSNVYVDPLAPDIQFFKKRYFENYGLLPTTEAFLGYDVMLYFGRMIHKHGTKFQYMLESEEAQYLHTRFEFERVVDPTSATTGQENLPIEQWENKYVNILKFQDYQFELANQRQ